jgi:outer membrane protein OmpA-like peptidoglycan-associated protein
MNIRGAVIAIALLSSGAALAQEMELQVELMGPLGTKTSHRGDRVFGRVARPDAFKGDTVEGVVSEVRSGGKFRGNAVLNFSFDTLQHAGQAIAINTQIRSFQNSQGKADIDEEGRVIRKGGGNTAKALAGTGVGGLIGGLAGGAKGAAIGAGVGAAASIAVIEITADAPDIRFNPGSIVTVSAKARSGPPLDSFTGGSTASAPTTAVPAAPPPPPPPASAPIGAPIAAAPAGGQPDLRAVKADFIPGNKVLFYDDFTDMVGEEPPPHWKVRGAAAELRVGPGIRQVSFLGDRFTVSPNLTSLPPNFTMEMDFVIDPFRGQPSITWEFRDKARNVAMMLELIADNQNECRVYNFAAAGESLGSQTFPIDWTKLVKVAIWAQNGRVRLYINGSRIFDANQVKLPEIDNLEISSWAQGAEIGYRFARFAESIPGFAQVIASSGRYTSYGILFDTDSDRLKPESAAAIKSIASGLQADPALKVRIEGHTDSSGDAAHNLDLSKRRAEAVKAVLVAQFQVDAARLSADGLGSAKPVGPNDSPQGRAQNRRVEFVKE